MDEQKKKLWEEEFEQKLEQSIQIRNEYWKTAGELDDYVMSHLINPMFIGGPRWPASRQSFIRIIRENSVILASDGLSDPFDVYEDNGEFYNGTGLEFYIECSDPALRGDWEEVKRHWAFELLYEMSQNAASRGNMHSDFESYGILSMEFNNLDTPDEWQTRSGATGVLLGLPAEDIKASLELPYETVRLISIKLLTPEQLAMVIEHGAEGRRRLAEEFQKNRSGHMNLINS